MRRIPKRFTLKGKDWTVEFEKDLKHDDGTFCDGLCDLDTRTIWLEKALDKDKRIATFLHEISHAMIHETHIRPGARFSDSLECVLCDGWADLMQTLFKLKWKQTK